MVEAVETVSEAVTRQADSVFASSQQVAETSTEVAYKSETLARKADQRSALLDEFILTTTDTDTSYGRVTWRAAAPIPRDRLRIGRGLTTDPVS